MDFPFLYKDFPIKDHEWRPRKGRELLSLLMHTNSKYL